MSVVEVSGKCLQGSVFLGGLWVKEKQVEVRNLMFRCVWGIFSFYIVVLGVFIVGYFFLQKEEVWVLIVVMIFNFRDCICGMGVFWGCGVICLEVFGLQGMVFQSEVVFILVRVLGEQLQEKVCFRLFKVLFGRRIGFVIFIDKIIVLNSICFYILV